MKFIEIINNKKYTLISIFLFFYVALNLIDGERGLISYFEKQKIIEELINEKKSLVFHLQSIEKKNSFPFSNSFHLPIFNKYFFSRFTKRNH